MERDFLFTQRQKLNLDEVNCLIMMLVCVLRHITELSEANF